MLKLILNNIGKRRIQSVSILISVLISAAVLFAMFLLYNGVSDGIDTSEQRRGADIVVVPGEAEELLDENQDDVIEEPEKDSRKKWHWKKRSAADAGDADAAAVPAVSADVVAAIRPAEDQRDAAKRPDQRPAA